MAEDIINLPERRKAMNQAAFQEILNAAKDLEAHFMNSGQLFVGLARGVKWYALVGSNGQNEIAKAGVLKKLAEIRESLTKDKLSDSEAVQQALAMIEKKLAAVV